MSLENAITENTFAIHELIRALKEASVLTPSPETVGEALTKKQTPAKDKPSSGSTKTEVESAAPSDTGESAQEFTEDKPLDFKTLSTLFVDLIKVKGRESALAILAELGLKDGEKLSDLDPTKWVEAFNLTKIAINAD